jgi:hypothetical protein
MIRLGRGYLPGGYAILRADASNRPEGKMNGKISDLAIGPGIPLALSALWYGVLRLAISKTTAHRLYAEPPMKFVVPVALLVLSLVIIVAFWNTRRLTSYGTIALLIFGLIVTLMVFKQGAPR